MNTTVATPVPAKWPASTPSSSSSVSIGKRFRVPLRHARRRRVSVGIRLSASAYPGTPVVTPLTVIGCDYNAAIGPLAQSSSPMARVLIERRLTRVSLRDYQCIASCDVRVRPLSVLVGPNGSGKSSFLDALRLVSDALRYSLGHALQERGGFAEVRRRTSTTAGSFVVVLRFRLPGAKGAYGCRIARKSRNGYVIRREQCTLSGVVNLAHYRIDEGAVVETSIEHPPNANSDELYLSRIASIPPFDQVHRFLSNMTFYNPSVDRIRELQTSDEGRLLKRDGSNVASVLNRLKSLAPDRKSIVDDYLAVLVPQIDSVEPRALGPKITVEFRQRIPGSDRTRRFLAGNMSDGTLRGLGVLVALFQHGGAASAIGVEEPELGLHAGVLGGLADALLEASQHMQTFATTHSAELLDSQSIPFKYVRWALSRMPARRELDLWTKPALPHFATVASRWANC